MKRSIYKKVENHSQASERDILEMQKYLNNYETPLRASEQYAVDKSNKFGEDQGRAYHLRWYKFFFLKYAPVEYI